MFGGVLIITDDGLGTFQNEGAGQVNDDGTTVLSGDVTVTGTGNVFSIYSANISLAGDAGSTADMIVTAPASPATGPTGSVDASGGMEVGYGGSATLTVEDGAQVTAGFINIGQMLGSQGTVDISGSGTTVNVTAGPYQDIAVGFDGTASLTISEDAQVTATSMDVGINYDRGVTDTVTVDDATLNVTQYLTIGEAGTGTATIEDGASLSASDGGVIGNNAGSTGTLIVTGAGSTLDVADYLTIGNSGTGTVVIEDGAAYDGGGIGVGFDGTASLTIADQATVTTTGLTVAANYEAGIIDTVDVNDATLNVTQYLTIGDAGTGTATIEDGASLSDSEGGVIGNNAGSTGSLTVTGEGSNFSVTGSPNGVNVGFGGDGNLTVEAGATFTSDFLNIAQDVGSIGTVIVEGPGTTLTTTTGQYQNIGVGFDGTASLTIADQATVTTTGLTVAANYEAGIIDIVDVNDATLNVEYLIIGNSGAGTATFENGATVNAGSFGIADNAGSAATVTITGAGTVATASTLWLGAGSAALIIADGGTLDVTGAATGTGSVLITNGGIADFQGAFDQSVTFSGAGTLELAQSDGGTISGLGVGGVLDLTNVSESTASVQWVQGTGSGTLQIYNSGAMTESLMLEGTYSQGDFFLFPDSGTGTEVAYGNDEWTGTSGNWTNSTWTNGAPSSSTDAAIDVGGGNYTVTSSSDVTIDGLSTASNITLDIAGGTFTVNYLAAEGLVNISGGTLDIGDSPASAGSLTQSSGALTGSATFTVTGVATISGGEEDGSGTTIFQGGLTLPQQGGAGFTLNDSRIVELEGTSTTGNANDTITLNDTSQLIIESGATFDDTTVSGANHALYINGDSTVGVDNLGTYTKSGDGTTDVTVPFDNTGGTVDVEAGTLNLEDGGTDTGATYEGAGTIEFSASRTLDSTSSIIGNALFSSGTVTVDGRYAAQSTNISGGTLDLEDSAATTATLTQSSGALIGTATLTVIGAATISGGEQDGSGTTIFQDGLTLLAGTGFTLNNSRSVELEGTSTTGNVNDTITLNDTSQLIIESGAAFDDTTMSGANHALYINGDSTVGVDNLGTYTKSGDGTTDVTVPFVNSGGTVDVEAGTLNLEDGGADTRATYEGAGTIEFSASRTLDSTSSIIGNALFSSGTVTVDGSYAAQSTNISGGTLDLEDSAATTATLTQSSGALIGTATLTVIGAATISGGEQDGSGTTIFQDGLTLLAGTGFTLNNSRSVELEGTSTTGNVNDTITLNDTSQLIIESGAAFDDTTVSGANHALYINGDSTVGVDNLGTYTKSGDGTTDVTVPFDNSGTIEVQSGTLLFDDAVSNSGAGNALIEGSIVDFAATSNVDEITFNNGTGGTTYGELILGAPSGYTATINGFAGTAPSLSDSDGIELAGTWTVASETPSGGNLVLVLQEAGSENVTLTFDDFSGTLNIATSGGNTLITDPPATSSSKNLSVDFVAAANSANGIITFADADASNVQTAAFTPEAPNYSGTFSLHPMTESNGVASVLWEFNLANDQINFAPGQTVTQSYDVSATDPQNPAASVNQIVSVSIGGPGNDNFIFQPGIGADTIVNFNPQADTIELDHFANAQSIQELASLITTDAHGDAVIDLGHNDSITLPGMTANYLQAHLQSLVHLH